MLIRSLALTVVVLLAGCAGGGKSYYVLTADGPAPSGGGVGIGVGPVTVAEYIDRPNLVVAEGPNQLGIAEDHRWAGDLQASVKRVTAANLGRRMKSGNVREYPWGNDGEIRYQVILDVRQMHAANDGHAVIEAGWRAYLLPDRKLMASRTFVAREPLEADGYAALVAAQSRLLSRLADDISAALR
ncbi:MAG: PqiC family protein [Verrucomicrobiales bacterium]|nr:PqiC family protein [Verrucomicrobiota bacterium JB025]